MSPTVSRDDVELVGVGIGHHFGSLEVLHSITLSIRRGEWVALTGPSGSGKTTLLAIMGGLLRPTAGATHLVDAAGARHNGIERSVAWVLQTATAIGTRSVLDNAALGGLSAGMRSATAAEVAAGVLATVGLDLRLAHRAKDLSGGEMQRLSIARALTSARPFLFADEPTGQLDRKTSDQVMEAMAQACSDVGVLIATHDPSVAQRCQRTLTLQNGHLNGS